MVYVASILLAVVINWWIVRPLFSLDMAALTREEGLMVSLLDQKNRCLQTLHDLELDFMTNKINSADYSQMKDQISQELSFILSKLDAQSSQRSA